MRKLLALLVLPGFLLVGCTTWQSNEYDYLHMVAAMDPSYNADTKDSTILNRGYGACHMLQAGLPEVYVLQQVPEDRDPAKWNQDVQFAKAFLCPDMLKKVRNAR